ncbi:hypothetical protein AAFC00_007012 [Neodothiora populina]|uniref:DUF202 domain-containing protein n=1 Tax=Neodothiora populina TaxID=2781224 RepID=A0ABR3PBX9_9PEZI
MEHYPANERTFLAYLRTSVALSMIGIVTTQLFGLQRRPVKNASHGYHAFSKPLGALFQIAAMMVTMIGAHRYWRQQMSMARGKVWAGGWELYVIMGTVTLLLMFVFALLIGIDVNEENA